MTETCDDATVKGMATKITDIPDPIDSEEAAELIGCSQQRVRQLVEEKVILGVLWGRKWVISKADCKKYRKTDRRPGRKAAVSAPAR